MSQNIQNNQFVSVIIDTVTKTVFFLVLNCFDYTTQFYGFTTFLKGLHSKKWKNIRSKISKKRNKFIAFANFLL
ncbi:MAG: hypothetical protein J6T41_06270, partial [Neisseriaceae bacterium]|nr:hypothetical protein [Neisseriaceae bacterium]